ncbi:MAG TPA: hypothetical protein VL332_02220 [Candidatus Saccharimonadaceae bacterium]|nr:hypothetical protein [Candidatus Saccharimonadaceae bacterium]
MRRSWCLALAVSAALAAPSSAGTVRGVLWLAPPEPGAAENAARHAQPGVADAVVYVDRVPDKVEKKLTHHGWFWHAPRLPRIVQQDRRFDPRVLAVARGTSVEFQNLDSVYHNAFSVSVAKPFDLGKYPPGTRDTVLFDRAGAINLHCDIHPDMVGFVVVVPNHVFCRPDSMGAYKLPRLPQGRYSVRVWHPHRGEIRRDVVVPHHGDVDLTLVY